MTSVVDRDVQEALPAADILDFLSTSLTCTSTSWNMGSFGAVAEFHHTNAGKARAMTVRSDLGAIRIRPVRGMSLIAYEMLSAQPDAWHHGVLVCVPKAHALERASGLVELGADEGAVQEKHRGGILFDLGLGSIAFRFCVRLFEADHIAFARRFLGQQVVETHCDLFQHLLRWSPHRVAISPVARIEVYQPIASPDGETPVGPHTHLIPHLLRPALTHSSYMPLPRGRLIGLTAYPANPVRDQRGRMKPFDADEHRYFQQLLSRYGNGEYLAAKARATRELMRRGELDLKTLKGTRVQRNAWRITARQLAHELTISA